MENAGAFMLLQLQSWFENIKKRQVKALKLYFRDSGILHHQLGIKDEAALLSHPKLPEDMACCVYTKCGRLEWRIPSLHYREWLSVIATTLC